MNELTSHLNLDADLVERLRDRLPHPLASPCMVL